MGNATQQLTLKSISVDEVPNRLHLAAAGAVRTSKGDFVVDADSARQIKAAMTEAGVDLVVDYEHQTLKGTEAPAAGWIKDVEFVAGEGLYAMVEWTDHARQRIAAKEYRYASPVVNLDAKTRRLVSLHSVALTNKPATRGMRPIAAKDDDDAPDRPDVPGDSASKPRKEGDRMKDQLIGLLALKADASEEDVVQAVREAHTRATAASDASKAIETLSLVCKAAGIEASEPAKIEAAVMVLAQKAKDHDTLKAENDRLHSEALKEEADRLIKQAKADGKLVEAQEEWANALILKDKSAFESWAKSAPVVRPQGQTTAPATSATPGGGGGDRRATIQLACKEYDENRKTLCCSKREYVDQVLREQELELLSDKEEL